MTPIPPSDLYKEIRETDVAEDYEFDVATVEEINDLFIEFLNEHAFEDIFREQANKTARNQAQRLSTALEACRTELHAALANTYVGVHLSEQYAEQLIQKHGDEEVAYDVATHLGTLLDGLSMFATASKAVAALPSLDAHGLPTFSRGRGESRDKLKRLVSGLYAIACRYAPEKADPGAAQVDRARERLEIIQELIGIVSPGGPSLKTLRNILSDLRSSSPSK